MKMENNEEKIAICYSCCGPTFRESTLDKITNIYEDRENLYYFILTDNKDYFSSVKRKNFYVNEPKDFFDEYPLLEKNEPLIYADSKDEYAKIFLETRYTWSFSLMRLHLLQALEKEISNVMMLCTDTHIHLDMLDHFPEGKDRIFNAVSEWDVQKTEHGADIISDYLLKKYNYTVSETIRVLDAAARYFRFSSLEKMEKFFVVWNDTIEYLYETKLINRFKGSYNVNDEYILAPIYDMFKLNWYSRHAGYPIFEVNHDIGKERFWMAGNYTIPSGLD